MTAKRPAAAVVLALALVAAGTAVLLVGCDEVTPDTEPGFGAQTVADQAYTVGEAIASLVLPGASGGNPPLTYSLTPAVPGLSFSPSTRTLSGTPTAAAEGTHAMTYRVEDADGDAATLRFDVRVNPTPVVDAEPSFGPRTVADQTYTVGVSIASLVLPEASGGNTPLTYSLTPAVPGLSFSPSTRTLRGTPAAAAEGTHAMTYRVEDADGDFAILTFTVRVNPADADTQPSFGRQTVSDHTFWVGSSIRWLALPEAGGGNPPLTYSLTPEVPGLWFNPVTRIVGGTPTQAAEGVHTMTYRVEDVDGDLATLTFELRIDPADTEPSFGQQTVADQTYTVGTAIAVLLLPTANGGDGTLTYSLRPAVPGLTFNPAARTLTGTPSAAAEGIHAMTYRVEDSDGDAATLRFKVLVNAAPVVDTPPSFGDQTVADQTYVVHRAIEAIVLPEASGGDPPLRYTLSPDVPGLRFRPSTRTLSGRPTEAAEGVHTMTYRVEDADGDMATLTFDVLVNPRYRFVPVPAVPHCLQIGEGQPGSFSDPITNICTEHISVWFCMIRERRGCGTNGRESQPYYTHFRFGFGKPGDTGSIPHIRDAYRYAVCQGDLNPFTEGVFVSDANGNYSCFKRVES